jgi:hypothetical protein
MFGATEGVYKKNCSLKTIKRHGKTREVVKL